VSVCIYCVHIYTLIVDCSWWTKKVEISWCWQAITFESAQFLFEKLLKNIYPSICLLKLSHLQVALNTLTAQEEKDVFWGMIHLMRHKHFVELCSETDACRLCLYGLNFTKWSEREKKLHVERRLNLIPKLEVQRI